MTDRFETFATTIAFLSRSIQRIKAREMEAVGLKSGHVMCMYALGKAEGGLTAAELVGASGEDKAAVSRTVAELEEKGYVHLDVPAEKRAYRSKILLTDKGRETVAYINRRVDEALAVGSAGLSEAQRSELYATLGLIAKNLDNYVREGGGEK